LHEWSCLKICSSLGRSGKENVITKPPKSPNTGELAGINLVRNRLSY
jgi:hypothetical protein